VGACYDSIVFAAVTALVYVPDALASTMTPAFATLYGAGQLDRIRDGFARALRLLLARGAALANVGGQVVLGLPLLLYAARLVGRFVRATTARAR
jgi:hypothetical protein